MDSGYPFTTEPGLLRTLVRAPEPLKLSGFRYEMSWFFVMNLMPPTGT